MRVSTLRHNISRAFEHEEKTQVFERHVQTNIEKYPIKFRCKERKSDSEILLYFAMEYIHQVPDFLESIGVASAKAGIDKHVLPFLKKAEDYFVSPPRLPNSHVGLLALMDESYLAHRLFEEVNDRYITRVGLPLIPWDMTLANVVAHTIIGESIANDLDEIVHDTASKMMALESEYESDAFSQYLQDTKGNAIPIWQSWPCLSKSMGIEWSLSPQIH